MKKKEDITHDGHRVRLINLLTTAGLDNVSPIQAVEGFLTFIFPRGDVNPLAHRLLNRYENFSNIIDADINDLITVKGLNVASARKIKLFRQMIDFYTSAKLTKSVSLKNNNDFLTLIENMLRFQKTEILYILAIAHNFSLIQKRAYDLKQVREVGLDPLELYNFISSTRPAYLTVVHNHPNGSAFPSKDDHSAMLYIEELIENLPCKLLDSIIVGEDGIFSEKQNGFLRTFKEDIDFFDAN